MNKRNSFLIGGFVIFLLFNSAFAQNLTKAFTDNLWVHSIVFYPNMEYFAVSQKGNIQVAGYDWSVRIYRINDFKCVKKIKVAEQEIGLVLSPDGKYLVMYGESIKIIQTTDYKVIKVIKSNGNMYVRTPIFSPDCHYLATGGADGTVSIWSTIDFKRIKHFDLNKNRNEKEVIIPLKGKGPDLQCGGDLRTCVIALVFSPDNQYFAVSFDDKIRIWNTKEFNCVKTLKYRKDNFVSIKSLHEKPYGNTVASDMQHLVFIKAFSPESKYLLLFVRDVAAYILDLNDYTITKKIKNSSDIALSPDGKYIVAYCNNDRMNVYNTDSLSLIKTLESNHGYFGKGDPPLMAFSSDGRYFMSGGQTPALKLWGLNGWEQIDGIKKKKLYLDPYTVSTLTISPDSKYIGLGTTYKTLEIWKIAEETN